MKYGVVAMSHNFDELCLCGHEFGDHVHRTPHRCPELAVSGRHLCTCRAFVSRRSKSKPENAVLKAASSGASHELARVVRELPEIDYGTFETN